MSIIKDQASSLRKRSTTNFRFASKKAVTCLTVSSGKGGVGKTFLAVNLALAFQKMNKKVLLVDADLGLANADILLGVYPEYTIQDALFQGFALSDAVMKTPYGVDLLAASSGSKELLNIGDARMQLFIEDLVCFASDYDILIFDCAAGIDNSVLSFIAAVPMNILVATPRPASMMDVYALMKVIRQEKIKSDLGLIINMVKSSPQADAVANKLINMADSYLGLRPKMLGSVLYSDKIVRALQARKPYLLNDPAGKPAINISEIAKTILMKQNATVRLRNLDTKSLLNGFFNNNLVEQKG